MEDNADTALIRLLTSNKDSRTRRSSGACDCQERIRQLVVFTPGSCPPQHAQPFLQQSRAVEMQSAAERCRAVGLYTRRVTSESPEL